MKKRIETDTLNLHIATLLSKGIDHALFIETSKVYTAPWVRLKCQFGCAGYGERLSCPPHTPTPEQTRAILDSYTRAILLHRHWQKNYKVVAHFNDIVVELETALFLDGFYKAFSLGSGPCSMCATCDTSGRCKNPEKARPSMEACGIDVFKTAREHNLSIRVVRNRKEERDIFGLVLIE